MHIRFSEEKERRLIHLSKKTSFLLLFGNPLCAEDFYPLMQKATDQKQMNVNLMQKTGLVQVGVHNGPDQNLVEFYLFKKAPLTREASLGDS
jgi:hypothetical protein